MQSVGESIEAYIDSAGNIFNLTNFTQCAFVVDSGNTSLFPTTSTLSIPYPNSTTSILTTPLTASSNAETGSTETTESQADCEMATATGFYSVTTVTRVTLTTNSVILVTNVTATIEVATTITDCIGPPIGGGISGGRPGGGNQPDEDGGFPIQGGGEGGGDGGGEASVPASPVIPPPEPTETSSKVTAVVLTDVTLTQSASTINLPAGLVRLGGPPVVPPATQTNGLVPGIGNPSTETASPETIDPAADPDTSEGGGQNQNPPGPSLGDIVGAAIDNFVSGQGNSGNPDPGANSNGQAAGSSNNPPSGSPQVVKVGGQDVNVSAGDGQGVVIDGETVPPGQVVTINGVQVSVPTSGGSLIIGGTTTVAINSDKNNIFDFSNPTPAITIGGSTITAGPSGAFSLAPDITLSPGGPAVTISGSTISLAPGGSIAVINGVTQTLGANSNPTPAPVITIGDNVLTASVAGSSTAFVFGPGTTLTPGGSVIVSGTTFSLPSTASGVVVVNGQTSTLGLATIAPDLTINGQTITPVVSNGHTSYILGPGTTLTPGGVITISGTKISMDPSGTALVFDGTTSSIPKTPASATASTTSTVSSTTQIGETTMTGVTQSATHTHKSGATRGIAYPLWSAKIMFLLGFGIFFNDWRVLV